ncbi:MAG: 30S ribosomal protein S8e [Theionarchaea archaeon]|nr:30S ribosomal protein S8e [Theionarchaea archaeon]MBU7000264.1 30S ribosomal protein S8e [Theionarchaea archaeon]MBU7022065.1 30S ribosomal protein S8e [Theionarchaea archaeon]MBU7034747.1 30S ribosomal protein S8e [Theionarchaea archaeon]MBU7040466.1 30S ribosomal protein S8e [Theionarchaea archaeon]
MALWQRRSKRTHTGKLLRSPRKKRKRELGRDFVETKIGSEKKKIQRTYGGNKKVKLQKAEYANVVTKEGTKKTRILSVAQNEANRHFVRRNIVTQGAVIETELGSARVTSRPGQHGIINAVLME